jgi:Arc/MetJ-type ribon-helix-helix transcriptional regulator
MPKKISQTSNEKLHFTLPKGARELLDQLVETQEVGGSHAEVIRYLVETQLQVMRKEGTISRKSKEK